MSRFDLRCFPPVAVYHRLGRLLRRGSVLLALLLVAASAGAAVDAHVFHVASGEVSAIDVSYVNRCSDEYLLALTSNAVFLDTSNSQLTVAPGGITAFSLDVDATTLGAGSYDLDLAVECLSCDASTTCDPRAILPIQVVVVDTYVYEVPVGAVTDITVPFVNGCPVPYLLELDSGMPFVDTSGTLELALPGLVTEFAVTVDTTALEPGRYDAGIGVICTSCGPFPDCDPSTRLPVEIVVVDDLPPDCDDPVDYYGRALAELGDILPKLEELAEQSASKIKIAAVRRADLAGADAEVGPEAAALERSIEELERFDRQFDEMRRHYSNAIRNARLARDYVSVWQIRRGRTRMIARFEDERLALVEDLEEAGRALEEAQARAETKADELEGARDDAAKTAQELVDGLAEAAVLKERLTKLLVERGECFTCDDFVDAAERLDELQRRAARLRARLRDAQADAEAERRAADEAAQPARDDLAEHDQRIAEIEQRMAEIENQVRRMAEAFSVEGLGPSPSAGDQRIGLLQGTEIALYFRRGRIELLYVFLRSDRYRRLRDEYNELRRELEGLRQERPDLVEEVDKAEAPVTAAATERNLLRRAGQEIDDLGIRQNVTESLDKIAEAKSECMAKLRECLSKLHEKRDEYNGRNSALKLQRNRLKGDLAELRQLQEQLEKARKTIGPLAAPSLDKELADIAAEIAQLEKQLEAAIEQAEAPPLPDRPSPRSVQECEQQCDETQGLVDETGQRVREAAAADREADERIEKIAQRLREANRIARRLKRYRERLEDYQEGIERKRAAIRRLQEIFEEENQDISEMLRQLEQDLSEAEEGLKALEDLSNALGRLEKFSDLAEVISAVAGDVAGELEAIQTVLRLGRLARNAFSDSLTSAQQAQILDDLFNSVRTLLPSIPGVDAFLEFYGDALGAIAVAVGRIENYLVERYVILADGETDPEIAETAVSGSARERGRRAVEIQRLLEELARPLR